MVKVLRSDNGAEYANITFKAYLLDQGIQHQTTCPYTSTQNGVVERNNRHLLDVTRSMMISMNAPKQLWGHVVLTTIALINRMPSRVLEWKFPCELLQGDSFGILPMKVFGYVCFVKDNRPSVGKLDPRAVKSVFVGYSATQKGYVCWSPMEKRLFVSMDVHFRESEPYYKQEVTSPFDDLIESENMREGDNGERWLKIGSSHLLIPTVVEKQVTVGGEEEEGKEDEEPICVGTQAEGELKVYTRKRR